jgi:hypothetical protein
VPKRAHYCPECDLEFTIKHEADEEHYRVEFCPFCGGPIDKDEEYEFREEEE